MDSPLQRLIWIGRDIKLSHSVFALPFAVLAAFHAAPEGIPSWQPLTLIVICMVFARTFAMLANRYVDRTIDAGNPRTAGRALPSGKLQPSDVRLAMGISGLGLVAGAAGFGILDQNWWPLILSPVVLLWLGTYGLIKRFSALCHFYLGGALAISPLAAAIAIRPESLSEPGLWYLSAFVLLWVGGFDIIYALQDLDVDRQTGLHSVPAKLGSSGALLAAKGAHLLALGALVMYRHSDARYGLMMGLSVLGVAILLVVEHMAAARGRFSMAFFTLNGVISLGLGAVGITDLLTDFLNQ